MNKFYDGIMGLVVGDALGVPVEFKKRDTYKITDMTGYGTHNQPPGTWSDDSSMTLATVESLVRLGCIDCEDIMRNFERWLYEGDFTPYGKVFDIGRSTYNAIKRFHDGYDLCDCGGKTEFDNGNGSLMRILPIALISSSIEQINEVSSLTHAHEISKRACRLYAGVVEQLLKGKSLVSVLSYNGIWINEFSRIPKIHNLRRDEIKSSGYVVDTLEAALWCLYHTNNYKDCVLMAVNLGEDTDTVAAVAGGLAGIMYGCGDENGVPDEWIAQIPRYDWIKELCEKLIFEN